MTRSPHLWVVGLLACTFSGCSGCIQYADIEQAHTRYKLRALEKRFEQFNGTYQIGIPDTLNINVPDHPDLSGSYEVRPDGNISFPLLGDVYVEGLTPMQLAETLAKRLERYVKKVEVLVTVTGFYSKRCYVFARDRASGRDLRFTGDQSAFDLLATSGGWSRQAFSSRIRLVRDNPEKPEVYRIRGDRILRGDLRSNILAKERDILYVPATPLAEVGYALEAVTYPIRAVVSGTQEIGQAPYAMSQGSQEYRSRQAEGSRY